MYAEIEGRAATTYRGAMRRCGDGFSVGEGIVFLMRERRMGAPWLNVIIHDRCLGPGLAMEDYMRPSSTSPERLLPLPSGPNLVFSHRKGYIEGNWRPDKFAAEGHDPVHVALRLIQAVLGSRVLDEPAGY